LAHTSDPADQAWTLRNARLHVRCIEAEPAWMRGCTRVGINRDQFKIRVRADAHESIVRSHRRVASDVRERRAEKALKPTRALGEIRAADDEMVEGTVHVVLGRGWAVAQVSVRMTHQRSNYVSFCPLTVALRII
jgi:hypothetical protein